jgi:hypothetical protein
MPCGNPSIMIISRLFLGPIYWGNFEGMSIRNFEGIKNEQFQWEWFIMNHVAMWFKVFEQFKTIQGQVNRKCLRGDKISSISHP